MNHAVAETLVRSFRDAGDHQLEPLEPAVVEGFHPWARNKQVLGVFRHMRGDDALHLLVMDWRRRPDHYYLVVFGSPTGAPVLEAHKVEGGKLLWTYTPRSRDGRNKEREKRFVAAYGSANVALPLPDAPAAVSAFLEEAWKAVDARRAAADVPEAEGEVAPPGTHAWIFQANPKHYDLGDALAKLEEITWSVDQHADRLEPNDRVFFWLSGKEGGLLAYGTVLTAPALLPLAEEERPFVKDEQAVPTGKALRIRVRVDEALDAALDREALREDPRLVGLSFLHGARGTTFPVSPAECEALLNRAGGGTSPRVVKIAPGEGAKYWEDCLKGGYICVGWDEVGDLMQYEDNASFREAFRTFRFYGGNESTVTKKANEVWTLRELKPGDIVVANKGTSEVLAIGRVIAPGYSWRPDRGDYKHTVAVEWDTTVARTIPKQSYWGTVTVTDVPPELFRAILHGPEVKEIPEGTNDASVFAKLSGALQNAGLSYSDEVLGAYLLALSAKRFVIFTGISGTGKTQLALTVARLLGKRTRPQEVAQVPDGAIELTVQPYMLKYSRLVIPRALLSELRLPDAVSLGGTGEIETEWPAGSRNLRIGQSGKNETYQLLFSGPFRSWFAAQFSVGDRFYIEPLETGDDSPHRLRFGIPQKVVQVVDEEPRVVVVAVRPDWTDNRGLLGYYNPILQTYVPTDFLRLLLRALAEERAAKAEGRAPEPYFVILDEMNLARVEHYFSDFLSAVESGEPLDLHNDDDVESGEKSDADTAIPKKVRIPRNLFFTGTVNVDETTYMFSPKVLDRAYVMELNQVDLEGFSPAGIAGNQHDAGRLRLETLPSPLRNERSPSSEDWERFGTLLDGTLRRAVVDLHRLLEGHNRHFGYRVANEIARFVVLAVDQCADGEVPSSALWTALDLALHFKVLPKLHGTQQELEGLLASLFAFATSVDVEAARDANPPSDGWVLEGDTLRPDPESGNEPAFLPRTAAKLYRMTEQARRRGFTSFIE